MRVGLVIYGSLETLSGGYLYDRRIVDHLRRMGDEVEVISLPWRSYPRHLLDNFRPELYHRLGNLKIDVLLEDELNHPSLYRVNEHVRGRVRWPVVSIVHHLRSSERHPALATALYRRVEQRYLRSVAGFVYNSVTTRETVETLRASPGRCVVAYPAGDRLGSLDGPSIQARVARGGPLRLLFVGNLIPRKGLHILLDALRMIPKMDWRLRIAGSRDIDPVYAARMEKAASALNGKVQFLGQVSEDDLRQEMRTAQVMALPSSYEGFGIVFLEGMAFGLPTLATTGGASGEVIRHEENGFLFPPEDPAALADGISRLASDRGLLAEMSLAARRRFDDFPSWEETAEKVRVFLLDFLQDWA